MAPHHRPRYFKVSELRLGLRRGVQGGGEGGREEATWLHEATAEVEQLSLFGWQIRVESDPVMVANWLKQRRIGQGNV